MKLIKWKYRARVNTWEGTVKGDLEPLISIHGHLCVTDIRHCRKSVEWVQPNHYKIIDLSINEAKQLAEDLVTGNNFGKHEKNRLDWIKENEKTVRLIQETDELIKKLQLENNGNKSN